QPRARAAARRARRARAARARRVLAQEHARKADGRRGRARRDDGRVGRDGGRRLRARRCDPARARRPRARGGAARRRRGPRVIIELSGLELFGYHGVLDEEKRDGQTFWFDVELEVGEWGANDRLDEAVDYRLVVDAVREV